MSHNQEEGGLEIDPLAQYQTPDFHIEVGDEGSEKNERDFQVNESPRKSDHYHPRESRSPSPKRSSHTTTAAEEPAIKSYSYETENPSNYKPERSSYERREKRYSEVDDGDDYKSSKSYGGDYKYKKDSFEYDTYVDMVGEGASFATAAHLSALEKRLKVLLEAIDKLEDKFYDSESKRMAVQRQLLIAEEVSADYRTLIDQRESQNVLIRKELDQLGVQYQNETSRFNEIDNERRKLEHKAALVQAEKDVNSRSNAKLEQYLAEIENLKHKLLSISNEKFDLDRTVNQRQKEVSDLEKKLHSESLRSREINNRTVANLENMIETERKRAQQSVDYVRQTLKAKIRVLEAQVEVDRTSDSNIKNEKRDTSRQLKNVKRKLDEKKSDVGRDKRKIEALSKQLASLKERSRKLNLENSDLENEQHTLKRETSTLATQVEATQFSNAKLHVLVPTSVTTTIEEEAKEKFPKPKPEPAPEKAERPVPERKPYKGPSPVIKGPTTKYGGKGVYYTADEEKPQEKPQEIPQEKPKRESIKKEEKESGELDLDSLERDLDTQVDIGDDLDELVRASEQGDHGHDSDPDNNIVIDDQ